MPTYYDPCSLVVFEALACGLPVITTACNGAGELITDGREGFVIPAPDASTGWPVPSGHDRRRGRRRMAEHAARLGRAQSFDRHVARLVQVFEEVAAEQDRTVARHAAVSNSTSASRSGRRSMARDRRERKDA